MTTSASTDPATEVTYPGLSRAKRTGRGIAFGFVVLVMLAIVLALGAFSGWVFLQRTERLYRDHIYPHVYTMGTDLSGMTQQEAFIALNPVAERLEQGTLVLTDGDEAWTYSWDEIGLHVDIRATVQDAYAVGRDGTWKDLANVWLDYHDVPPHYKMDENATQALLEFLSAQVSTPVTPASLKLEEGNVIVIPGKEGEMLDIDAVFESIQAVDEIMLDITIPLQYKTVQPVELDTDTMQAKVDPWLARSIQVETYDVMLDHTFTWTLGGEVIGSWLYLLPGSGEETYLAVNPDRVLGTLYMLSEQIGGGTGFRYEQAVDQILTGLENGDEKVALYLTHPERDYTVVAGDTLTKIAAKFGMPAGLVAEANTDIDINDLHIDQVVNIPSQDILTPNMPVPNKRIEVSLAEQRVRVYENGDLLWEWITSTGIASSPTNRGVFQVLSKEDEAYASQWDLWMPYFIGVYDAGGGVTNGFHELPILASGARLWAGTLGQPASFGCIILGIPEAETLYNWADIGVTVVIY